MEPFLINSRYMDLLNIILPFIITVCVMYITYQQWLISKRSEYFSLKKILDSELYKPIKDLTNELSQSKNNSIDKKKEVVEYIKNIKKINKDISILFKKADYEILIESFDKLINLTQKLESKIQKKIDIFKYLFLYFHYFLLIQHILSKIEKPIYRPVITIYSIIGNLVQNCILFLLPYCIEKTLRKQFYCILIWSNALIFSSSIIISMLTDTIKTNNNK